MIGFGTLMCLLAAWYWACWILRRDDAHRASCSCGWPAAAGVVSVMALESGWVVSEVGRQPWIVYNLMKVEAAATANTGVWVTFLGGRPALHRPRASPPCWSCVGMSRRFRGQDEAGEIGFDESDSPYGPNEPRATGRATGRRAGGGQPMSTLVAVVLFIGITAYAIFGGADFGAGIWDLLAGGTERGESATGDHRPLHRAGVGSQPRVAHLLLRGAVDRVPEACASITLTLFVPLTIAAFGIVLRGLGLRLPQGRASAPATGETSAPPSPSRRCWSRTAWEPWPAASPPGRVPAGGVAGDPWHSWINPTSILGRRAGRHRRRLPGRRLPGVGRRPPLRRAHGGLLPSPGAGRRRGGRGRGLGGLVRAAVRRPLPVPRPDHPGATPGDPVGHLRDRVDRAPGTTQPPRRTPAGHRRRDLGHRGLGRGPVGLHPAPDHDGVARPPRPRAPSRRCWWPPAWPSCSSSRPSGCCSRSTRGASYPARVARARMPSRPHPRTRPEGLDSPRAGPRRAPPGRRGAGSAGPAGSDRARPGPWPPPDRHRWTAPRAC